MFLASVYYAAIFFTLIFAVVAIQIKDLIHAAVLLGGSFLMLSLAFFLLKAPDVAFTQAAVGAALSTALFIFAIKKTRREE